MSNDRKRREIEYINTQDALKIALRNYSLQVDNAINGKIFIYDPEVSPENSSKKFNDQIIALRQEKEAINFLLYRLGDKNVY